MNSEKNGSGGSHRKAGTYDAHSTSSRVSPIREVSLAPGRSSMRTSGRAERSRSKGNTEPLPSRSFFFHFLHFFHFSYLFYFLHFSRSFRRERPSDPPDQIDLALRAENTYRIRYPNTTSEQRAFQRDVLTTTNAVSIDTAEVSVRRVHP